MSGDQVVEASPVRTPEELPLLFSADSHVIEDTRLWDGILPEGYFPPSAQGGGTFYDKPGRVDPVARVEEMARDGVEGEILYPTLGLGLFALEDASTQESAFRAYNSWLMGFCKVNPGKLFGIALLPCYDVGTAVKELERCVEGGVRGCEVWQTPHPDLPFTSPHYEPLWEAAASLGTPVSLHILTGFNYSREIRGTGDDASSRSERERVEWAIGLHKGSITRKLDAVADALLEIMFSGVLDRHPALRLVLVENEIGWIPFILDQANYYTERYRTTRPTAMAKAPTEYFGSQVFSTFFRDPVGMMMLDRWGSTGCMWSNDYPHPNSTWPNSREVVANNLGHLDGATLERVVRGTALSLYGIDPTR